MTPDSTPPTNSPTSQTARANALWAGILVEELIRSGVRHFFVAPGSRSTPLVAAIAGNDGARTTVHFDERGTAFAALGHARATGEPAAWVTTSGTAVANGLPAAVEASSDDVPMLLLTADRPPELRRTGANQTIDQPGIFGGYVRWEFDLPAPDPYTDPAFVLTTVDHAINKTLNTPPGPVHLNLMFREPFLLSPEDSVPLPDCIPEHLCRWYESGEPYTVYDPPNLSPGATVIPDLLDGIELRKPGMIVAGRMTKRSEGEAVIRLAGALGWPVLPDTGSQVRLGSSGTNVIPNYDLILADDAFAQNHRPDTVLHFGGGSVSKRLQQFITRSRPENYVVVGESLKRLDPSHIVTRKVQSGIVEYCDSVCESQKGIEPSRNSVIWNDEWRDYSERVESVTTSMLEKNGEITEPFVAREISRTIPQGHGLVVASSMPVRDMDIYSASDGNAVPVIVNRGASGIDGTISTAAGYAIGSGKHVTVLVGDLALLHDLNSLAMVRELPVTIVAINNDGGGIFSMLPVSRHESFFEEYFGTPHGLGFEDAARMFGLEYRSPGSRREFTDVYGEMCRSDAAGIIEVTTNRNANTQLRREIVSKVSTFGA